MSAPAIVRSPQADYFHRCVTEWHAADRECQRTHAIWQDAVARLKRLASKHAYPV